MSPGAPGARRRQRSPEAVRGGEEFSVAIKAVPTTPPAGEKLGPAASGARTRPGGPRTGAARPEEGPALPPPQRERRGEGGREREREGRREAAAAARGIAAVAAAG